MLRNDVANLFKHVAVSWCIAYTVGAVLGFLIVGLLPYLPPVPSVGAWAKGSPRGSSILSQPKVSNLHVLGQPREKRDTHPTTARLIPTSQNVNPGGPRAPVQARALAQPG